MVFVEAAEVEEDATVEVFSQSAAAAGSTSIGLAEISRTRLEILRLMQRHIR